MTERKLHGWVAIAEIISTAAVVISLIYVGLEIRHSTVESEADIQAELLPYTTQRRYLVIDSSELSSLLEEGYADPDRLSPAKMLRFQNYIELLYVAWERAYDSYARGILSEGLFDGWNAWYISIAKRDPSFVWPMVRDKQVWNPDFVQHVDKTLGHSKSDIK